MQSANTRARFERAAGEIYDRFGHAARHVSTNRRDRSARAFGWKIDILSVSADMLPACRVVSRIFGRQDARRPSQAGSLTSFTHKPAGRFLLAESWTLPGSHCHEEDSS